MIRINLLGTDRQKKAVPLFDKGRTLTVACSLILVMAALLIGWWYWSLTQQSEQVDMEIAEAQQEMVRLQPLIREVAQFEQRRAQLQQRVALIEQLRSGQSVPVQLLDHISRSLPEMLWLTQLDQKDNEVTIEGRSMTLIALSDFVGNLGSTPFLQKPIEILSSQVVAGAPQQAGAAGPGVEVIQFSVKAQIAPVPGAVPPAGGRAGGAPAAGASAPGRQGGAR